MQRRHSETRNSPAHVGHEQGRERHRHEDRMQRRRQHRQHQQRLLDSSTGVEQLTSLNFSHAIHIAALFSELRAATEAHVLQGGGVVVHRDEG